MAILLPDDLRARLAAEVDRLRPLARDVAWVATANLHLTLKFLGAVDAARLDAVRAALGGAGGPPFDLVLRGLGAFPSATRPRVLWAGAGGGHAEAAALAGRLEAALAPLGFAPEGRPFSAHVTLGRVREPRRNPPLADALTAAADRELGRLRVDRFALMRSDLSPRGARYTELATVSLSGH